MRRLNVKYITHIVLLLLLAGTMACAHEKISYLRDNSASTEKDQKGLVVTIQWIKWKGDKFDVQYWIENRYDHKVILRENAFGFTYEGTQGALRRKQRVFEYNPGQTDKFYLTFDFPGKVPPTGTATVTIDPVNEGDLEKIGKKVGDIKLQMPVTQNH